MVQHLVDIRSCPGGAQAFGGFLGAIGFARHDRLASTGGIFLRCRPGATSRRVLAPPGRTSAMTPAQRGSRRETPLDGWL